MKKKQIATALPRPSSASLTGVLSGALRTKSGAVSPSRSGGGAERELGGAAAATAALRASTSVGTHFIPVVIAVPFSRAGGPPGCRPHSPSPSLDRRLLAAAHAHG